MADRTFDRIKHFDSRSRNFPMRSLLAAMPTDRSRKRIWTPGPVLDQGREGACVGFGISGELGATPVKVGVDNSFARNLYQEAQAVDRSEGRNYSSGATVLAGLKAAGKLGLVRTYHWCFGIDDVIDALIRHSSVVLGIPWKANMYRTDERGLVDIGGALEGGHCIYAHGWWPKCPIFGKDMIVWQNSWGHEYGIKDPAGVPTGRGFIDPADLESLLKEDGEAAVLTDVRRTS